MEFKKNDCFIISKEFTLSEDIIGKFEDINNINRKVAFINQYGSKRAMDLEALKHAQKITPEEFESLSIKPTKLSREEIYNDIKACVKEYKKNRSQALFGIMRKEAKDLNSLSQIQSKADEPDVLIILWDILDAAGIDTYDKLDSFFNQIEEGKLDHLPKEQHNAVMTIFMFVDYEYKVQSEEIFLKEQNGL